MKPVVVFLPLRIVSVANIREHHMAKARRAKAHRATCHLALSPRLAPLRKELALEGDTVPHALHASHVDVRLTRVGKRKLDDDNLRSACKASRDGVADALGVDDADPRIVWLYDQSIGKRYELRVEVAPRARAGEGSAGLGRPTVLSLGQGVSKTVVARPRRASFSRSLVHTAHTPGSTVGGLSCPSGPTRKNRTADSKANSRVTRG